MSEEREFEKKKKIGYITWGGSYTPHNTSQTLIFSHKLPRKRKQTNMDYYIIIYYNDTDTCLFVLCRTRGNPCFVDSLLIYF